MNHIRFIRLKNFPDRLLMTRFRVPYTDFTVNDEIELLRQTNPARYRLRLQEIYGEMNDDRIEMERRGYLKPRQQ